MDSPSAFFSDSSFAQFDYELGFGSNFEQYMNIHREQETPNTSETTLETPIDAKFIARFSQEIQFLGNHPEKQNTLNSVVEIFKNHLISKDNFDREIESLPNFNASEKQALKNIGMRYLGYFFQNYFDPMEAKSRILTCKIDKVEEDFNSIIHSKQFYWKGALAEYCNVPELDLAHLEKFIEKICPLSSQLKPKWNKCITYFINTKSKTGSIQRAIEKLTCLFTEKYFELNFKSIIESPHFGGCYTDIHERCSQINTYIEKNPEQFTQSKVELCISQLPEYDGGENCYLFFIITPETKYINGKWEYNLKGHSYKVSGCLIVPFQLNHFDISFIDMRLFRASGEAIYGFGESSENKSFLSYKESIVCYSNPLPQKSFEPPIRSHYIESLTDIHHKPGLTIQQELPKKEKKKKVNRFEKALQKAKDAGQPIQPVSPLATPKSKMSPASDKSLALHKIQPTPKITKPEDFIKKLEDSNKKKVSYQPAEDKQIKDKSIAAEKRYSVTVNVRLGKTTSNSAVGEGRTAHQAKQNAAENYLKGDITLQSHKKEKKPAVEIKKIETVTKNEMISPEMKSTVEKSIKIEKVVQPIVHPLPNQNSIAKNATPQKQKNEKKPVVEIEKAVATPKKKNIPAEKKSPAQKSIEIEEVVQPVLKITSGEKSTLPSDEREKKPAAKINKTFSLVKKTAQPQPKVEPSIEKSKIEQVTRPFPPSIAVLNLENTLLPKLEKEKNLTLPVAIPKVDNVSDMKVIIAPKKVESKIRKIEKVVQPFLQPVTVQDNVETRAPRAKRSKESRFFNKKVLGKSTDSSAKKSAVTEPLKIEESAKPLFLEDVEKNLVVRQKNSKASATDETTENKKNKKSKCSIFLEKFETCGQLVTNGIFNNISFKPKPIPYLNQINHPTIYRDILNHSTIDEITAQVYNQQVAVYVKHKNLEQLSACYSTLTSQHSLLNGKNISLKAEWYKTKNLQKLQKDDSSEESTEFLVKGKKIKETQASFNKLSVEEVKSNTFLVGNPPVEELLAGEMIPTDSIKLPFDPETRVIRIQTTHETSSFKVIHKGGEKLELDIEILQQKIKFLKAENEKLRQKINAHKQS